MTKKRDEFRTLISREEKMVMADPTRDKVRGFENYIAEKVSEYNKLAARASKIFCLLYCQVMSIPIN